MPFEVFTKQRAPVVDEPSVTIQRKGIFSLNAAAYNALESPEAVELLYDRDERLIGFRSAKADDPYAYRLRAIGRNARSFVVAGKAFVQFYDIPIEVARRWRAVRSDDLLVIDLKEPGVEVVGNRRKPSGNVSNETG